MMDGTGSMNSIRKKSFGYTSLAHVINHHDIYACYSDKNSAEVLPILHMLIQKQLTVYDPYTDGYPNETLFKAWLERGIHKAKLSLIFLTKSFIQSPVCRYQSDNAVMHYVRSKGRHRVVLVMLESCCKVPKNLRQFNCLFAWHHQKDPLKQHLCILKAIFAPKTKFRRGSILWTGGSTSRIGNKKCWELPMFQSMKANLKTDLKTWTLLLNLTKVKFVLENCEIKCRNDNCTYHCEGVHRFDQYVSHIRECKYQHVCCSFCGQHVLLKNLQKHKEKACRFKHIPCPNEGCYKKIPAKQIRSHVAACTYRELICPNVKYGCVHVFAVKDSHKHLEICDYVQQWCKRCHAVFFRVDIESHKCVASVSIDKSDLEDSITVDIIPALYKCRNTNCQFVGAKSELELHLRKCVYKVEQCSECGIRLPVNELAMHRKQCDKIVECEICHQNVPSSSKITHDRWSCRGQAMKSLCDICHSAIEYSTLDSHRLTCGSLNTDDVSEIDKDFIRFKSQASHNPDEAGSSLPEGNEYLDTYQRSKQMSIHGCDDSFTAHEYNDDWSFEYHFSPLTGCKWNKEKRQRWRNLMSEIDLMNNQSDTFVNSS